MRAKAKDLAALLMDDDKLRDERKKARKNKDRYQGVSNEDDVRGPPRNYNRCAVIARVMFV